MDETRVDVMPEVSMDCTETARLLNEILDSLPDEQRIVLSMRFSYQMSINEIADELGVNPNTVKNRLAAGKKKVEIKVRELE